MSTLAVCFLAVITFYSLAHTNRTLLGDGPQDVEPRALYMVRLFLMCILHLMKLGFCNLCARILRFPMAMNHNNQCSTLVE